ncbi:hypothetical protein cyc_01413 [Cyclospora cayetanensis]|uniref:non-specific serine/threonine protein kinase n=1 Tax=Cyclospora cayetanensis TaxID=88456 RepID=A0A1D3D8M1_9EIME|nr:hypothetical protein cyc_01413 [Cyclospora cayetanensis]
MHRPSPRIEGVDVELASKRRLLDGSVWLNQYRVCEKLASTELSSVFRVEGTNADTGEVTSYCCKRYRKMLLLRRRDFRPGPTGMGFKTKMEDVKEEARMLSLLKHPRCLELQAILDSNLDSAEGKVYFLTNFLVGGALMVLRPLRDGMQERSHLLKDLKVDNLLLGADGRVCVGDFGSAEKMGANGKVRHTKGTYMFMAPECFRPLDDTKLYEGHDGRAADAWALGICTYVMVFGVVPFDDSSIESLFEALGEGVVTIPSEPPISPELRDFLGKVLHPEWKDRMSVRQILSHPWVASANYKDAADYAGALLQQRSLDDHIDN